MLLVTFFRKMDSLTKTWVIRQFLSYLSVIFLHKNALCFQRIVLSFCLLWGASCKTCKTFNVSFIGAEADESGDCEDVTQKKVHNKKGSRDAVRKGLIWRVRYIRYVRVIYCFKVVFFVFDYFHKSAINILFCVLTSLL